MNFKPFILALLITPAIGCNGVNRIINGGETGHEQPQQTTTWDVLGWLPSGDAVPVANPDISGLMPNRDLARVRLGDGDVVNEGYVRQISDGTWVRLRTTTSFSSTQPWFAVVDGGIEIKKLHSDFDAVVIYLN